MDIGFKNPGDGFGVGDGGRQIQLIYKFNLDAAMFLARASQVTMCCNRCKKWVSYR